MTNLFTKSTNSIAGAQSQATDSIGVYLHEVRDYIVANSNRIAGAIVIAMLGVLVSRWAVRVMTRALERKQLVDPALRLMLLRFVRFGILGVSIIIALELCGFPMTALITSIGVVGVGIGFAMQGLLSNIIAGLTIIVTKPFRIGEFVGILNCTGVVDSIDLTTTTLNKPDGSRILIPNSKIINEVLQNYGVVRQLDLSVGVAYSTDLTRVQALIHEILRCNSRVLREPSPAVMVAGMGESAVNIAIKPFVKLQDMGAAITELNQSIVEKFRASNIEIPYAQHEVRILSAGGIPPKP